MAISIKTPLKKKQITRSKIQSIDLHYIGPEPVDINPKGYVHALNWYNYMYDVDQSRDWLLEYMKRDENYDKVTVACVRKAPKHIIPTTIGWQARIMMNGNTLPASSRDFFKQHIDSIVSFKDTSGIVDIPDRPVVSIAERAKAKFDALFAECEIDVVDNRGSMWSFLHTHQVNPSAATFIKNKYIIVYDEVMSSDPDVSEAYGKRLKNERTFWQKLITDLDTYIGNKRTVKVRKPKTKKVISAVDLTKKLVYQKEFAPLKIVSINPADIVSASQIWVYNTKTRKLTAYNTEGPRGIQVKGTTLIGWSVATSVTKSLRKPDLVIPALLSVGKVGLRKFMSEIKTNQTTPTGRINKDTILLRATK